jgi:signal transduction histidine kinase
MEAMSDIVWTINAGNDRFENIIIRMRELAVELIETKKCTLNLQLDEQLNTLKLGMNERKNFWLIYKEALNNIAKYAAATQVWISLRLENKYIVLVIKDDGKGFDTTAINSGNGLKNMQQRAQAINGKISITSAPGKGTCVELRVKV